MFKLLIINILSSNPINTPQSRTNFSAFCVSVYRYLVRSVCQTMPRLMSLIRISNPSYSDSLVPSLDILACSDEKTNSVNKVSRRKYKYNHA